MPSYIPYRSQYCGIVHTLPGHYQTVVVYLPLEQLQVHAEIVDVSATVTLTQTFWQCSPSPTSQAKYVFPVPSRAAVCAFEMSTEDGRVVKAVAKEKEQARREHQEAISQGKLTGLVEHVRDDVFTISLGCLPQLQMITTKLTYVLDLMDDDQADQVRFQLPVCVGARYGTLPTGMVAAKTIPPSRVRISADVFMRGAIQSITSSSHPTLSISSSGGIFQSSAHLHGRVVKYISPGFLAEDFVLSIKAEGLDTARCFAERGVSGSTALQLTVAPQVKLPAIEAQEYIFLVDRSGSMGGTRIETAKRALVMLLRALPRKGTSFNIFSFGTTCSSLWTEAQAYDAQTLEAATRHVDQMSANFGGTKMRSALEMVFRSRCAQLPTSCFVLTDGEAWDTQNVIASVKHASSDAHPTAPLRCFTLGIGSTTSTEMCEGIARASGGVCLMSLSEETIIAKCSKLVKASRSEILRNVTIDWSFPSSSSSKNTLNPFADPQRAVLHQGPEKTPSIFGGIRFTVFALITDPEYVIPEEVVVQAKRANGEVLSFTVPVEQLRRSSVSDDEPTRPLIHTLAARRIIMDLEDTDPGREPTEMTKSAIVHLGEQYQLASKFTSFIAVEGENNEQKLFAEPFVEFGVPSFRSRRGMSRNTGSPWLSGQQQQAPMMVGSMSAMASPLLQSTGGMFGGAPRAMFGAAPPGAAAPPPPPPPFGGGQLYGASPLMGEATPPRSLAYSFSAPRPAAAAPPPPPVAFGQAAPAVRGGGGSFGSLNTASPTGRSAPPPADLFGQQQLQQASSSSQPDVPAGESEREAKSTVRPMMVELSSSWLREYFGTKKVGLDTGSDKEDRDELKAEAAAEAVEAESRSGGSAASISFGVPASVSRDSVGTPSFRDAPASAYTYTSTSPPSYSYSLAAAPPAPPPPAFAGNTPPPPAQPLSPAVLQSSEDAVVQLVRLQSFDGSFSISPALRHILGHTAIAQFASIGVDEQVWVTVLAIAYLQKHLVGQPDLLEGLVEKAMEFVGEVYEGDVEVLLEKARDVVSQA